MNQNVKYVIQKRKGKDLMKYLKIKEKCLVSMLVNLPEVWLRDQLNIGLTSGPRKKTHTSSNTGYYTTMVRESQSSGSRS